MSLPPFRTVPDSGPLPSAGVTPRPRYYGPIRHPDGPACPSRGSGCRVHGTGGASRVAAPSIFPCVPAPLPRRKPAGALVALFPASRRPSPILRRVGFRNARFEACSAFTRVPARMVAEPPKAALSPECFSPCRYLREPLWPLPAGATVAGWDSHPPGKRAFPRRTEKSGLACYATGTSTPQMPMATMTRSRTRSALSISLRCFLAGTCQRNGSRSVPCLPPTS